MVWRWLRRVTTLVGSLLFALSPVVALAAEWWG